MSAFTGSEQRPKILDQVLGENQQLMQRWNERLHFGNPQFSTRWMAGSVVFALKIIRKDTQEVRWLVCYSPKETWETQAGEKIPIAENKKLTVLIDNVKVMDSPERFTSSFVGPEIINSLLSFGGHACYHSRLHGFVILEGSSDWKTAFGTRLSTFPVGEVPSQMIQRTTEVMNSIARTRNEIDGNIPRWFGADEITLRISEKGYDVRANFLSRFLDLEDVMFGPIGLYPNHR